VARFGLEDELDAWQEFGRRGVPLVDALLEPVAVGPDEFEDTAAEFARSVQIVSPLPDHTFVFETGSPVGQGSQRGPQTPGSALGSASLSLGHSTLSRSYTFPRPHRVPQRDQAGGGNVCPEPKLVLGAQDFCDNDECGGAER
jgi:hypothetical protein